MGFCHRASDSCQAHGLFKQFPLLESRSEHFGLSPKIFQIGGLTEYRLLPQEPSVRTYAQSQGYGLYACVDVFWRPLQAIAGARPLLRAIFVQPSLSSFFSLQFVLQFQISALLLNRLDDASKVLVGLRLTEGTVAVPDPNLELREQRSFAVAAHGDLSSLMRSNGLRKVSFVAVQSGPRYLELPCR